METITMTIDGMSCGGCVASVTRVLRNLPGVADVAVSLAPPQARVTYDPATAPREAIEAAIEDAGYGVGK
jgi:copper chaperone